MFEPAVQEILAPIIVAATLGVFLWRRMKKRQSAKRGCGGSCSCASKPGK